MASSMRKSSGLSKDQIYEPDLSKNVLDYSSIVEEQRLLHPERPLLKKSVTHSVSQKQMAKFNTFVNQMASEQVDNELKKRQLSTRGEIEIRRHRLKRHHNAGSTTFEQRFEYIAVVDFEATCEDRQGRDYVHEIIEFPIVLIDVQQQTIVDQFQSYCRPTMRPILSKFCTDLTGIEQHQVNSAPTFVEVFRNVETWLNERNLLSSSNQRRLAFATDGPWDFANFLQIQCHTSSIPYPRWAEEWINIRKEFSCFYNVRRCGIVKMLEKLGLSFNGRQHSGIDDAINIARIGVTLLEDGCVLSLNDRIRLNDPKLAAIAGEEIEFKCGNDDDDDAVAFTG